MSGPAPSGLTGVEPTLAHFSRLFAQLGIDWCVAGAVAANAYRAPRDTTDLDLIVHIPAALYPEAARTLEAEGWRTIRVSPDTDYPDVVRLEHDSYSPTDFLLVKTAYQAEALQRARPVSPAADAARSLAPEDVVVHKLIANRHRDRADVFEILLSGTPLDREYIERWAVEWDVLARWQEALAETSR